MLIIGSRAAKHYIEDFRKPKDWDVVCWPREFDTFRWLNPELEKHLIYKHEKKWILRKPGLQIEFEIAVPGGSGEILLAKAESIDCALNLDICPLRDFPVKFQDKMFYATPEILTLIKKSHVGYQIHWDKNILDYSVLKSHSPNMEFYSLVFAEFMEGRAWEMKGRFSKRKKIDLDKKNSEFFNITQKSVQRKYPHDLLHTHTCYGTRPIYELLKTDLTNASIDETLWNTLNHQTRVNAVREEGFVIALERKIIPAKEKGETWDRTVAFRWALMRISTNLTNGFFQQFALDNHIEIMKDIPPFDERFFSRVSLAV